MAAAGHHMRSDRSRHTVVAEAHLRLELDPYSQTAGQRSIAAESACLEQALEPLPANPLQQNPMFQQLEVRCHCRRRLPGSKTGSQHRQRRLKLALPLLRCLRMRFLCSRQASSAWS